MDTRLWRGYLLLGILSIGVYFALPTALARDTAYELIGASAFVAIILGIRRHHPRVSTPWLLMAAGQLMFVVGDILFDYLVDVRHVDLFPSTADVLYLAGYPLLAAGLLVIARRRSPGNDQASLIDALIIAVAMVVVVWVFWIDRYADSATLTLSELAFSVAYPMMDLILLAVLARMWVTPGGRSPAYRLLLASFSFVLLGDILYYGLQFSVTYLGRNPLDMMWLLSYVALGAAALHPSMRSLTDRAHSAAQRLTRRRLSLLGAASLTAPVVFGIQAVRGIAVDAPIIVFGSAAMFLLVVARMAGLVRDVESNLDQLKIQSQALHQALEKEHRVVKELRELSRMKGDFVAMVSHELRTPLTSIIGFAKTLRQPRLAADPEIREVSIRAIERQGSRLLRLVENLLTASRLESARLPLSIGSVSFEDVCQEAVEGLLAGAERVRLAISPDLPELHTDRQLLSRVVSNLLDNALKYSPEGASCELAARKLGDRVEFSVQDRGIGIPTDQLQRVFDRFYQVDSSRTRNYTGVGLGLSLVKDLVGHLGGTVVVSSRPGAGSTFTVTLPVRYPGHYLEPASEPDVSEDSPAIVTSL